MGFQEDVSLWAPDEPFLTHKERPAAAGGDLERTAPQTEPDHSLQPFPGDPPLFMSLRRCLFSA